ncbi:MAG: hypothetical protein H7A23_03300 [Leptospiraceae bacterium]|nr:hypothetical protein [Leptospiraceae bacterium]
MNIILLLICLQFNCLGVEYYLRENVNESQVLKLNKEDMMCMELPMGENGSFRLVDLSVICKKFNRKELVYIRFTSIYNGHSGIKEVWCR